MLFAEFAATVFCVKTSELGRDLLQFCLWSFGGCWLASFRTFQTFDKALELLNSFRAKRDAIDAD